MPALRGVPVMRFTIRPADPVDFDAWRRLWTAYRHFYGVETGEPLIESCWARLLSEAEPMHCALAIDDSGRPMGLVHLIRRRSTWTTGYHCYLEDLFVEERTRGHGVATTLIEYAYAWARGQNCTSVAWLTHATNIRARRIYDRVAEHRGFIHYQKRL